MGVVRRAAVLRAFGPEPAAQVFRKAAELRASNPSIIGIGIGAMLSGRPIVAQPEMQIARAPEALSASFAEIARRVEPAVVNIETTQKQLEVAEKDEDKEDSTNPLLDMVRRPRRVPRGIGRQAARLARALAGCIGHRASRRPKGAVLTQVCEV